jgi:RNA polymerase sigma-70 factor (ECF subfamily)
MRDESALIEAARRFEEQALVEIYDRFSQALYRYAMRTLGNEYLAEECTAETFSRFLSALKNGGGPREYLQAYLYRVAHNWITDYYRRQPPPPLELNIEVLDGDEIGDPDHALTENLQAERVRAALLHLTEEQRQVVLLKFYEGWRNQEVAQALEKPIGAVKSLQHRGLNALRRILLREKEA